MNAVPDHAGTYTPQAGRGVKRRTAAPSIDPPLCAVGQGDGSGKANTGPHRVGTFAPALAVSPMVRSGRTGALEGAGHEACSRRSFRWSRGVNGGPGRGSAAGSRGGPRPGARRRGVVH